MKLIDTLNFVLRFLDLELQDVSDRYPYNQRKGTTWAVYDSESDRILCSYSTLPQIRDWLKRKIRS